MASLSEWKYSLLVTELSQAFTYAVVEVCTLRGNQIIVHLCTIGITLGRIGVKPGVGQTYAAGDAVLVHVGEASVGQLDDSLEFYRIVNRGGFKLVFVIALCMQSQWLHQKKVVWQRQNLIIPSA